jgi:hypothetical protein
LARGGVYDVFGIGRDNTKQKMINSLKTTLSRNITNARGWKTNRKIVVIESDDWGSIRMPSKEAFKTLLQRGIRVDNCHYCSNDSLETEKDLSLLFEVLNSVKDKFNKPAIFTANTLVANPDYEKIRENDFNKYHYIKIDEGFKSIKGSENILDLYNEGQDAGCFKIQSHGREHLNVLRWMKVLKQNSIETRLAFNLGVYGLSTNITSESRKSFLPAFDFTNHEEEMFANEVVQDGLQIFKDIFGFESKSFIAPNYTWGKSLENSIQKSGVSFIQGGKIHRYTEGNGFKSKKRLRYIGKTNAQNQIDLARNAMFEPSENPNKDWVNSCLADTKLAFLWKKPAIICSHRVNFMGGLNEKNRDVNLKQLKELLVQIKNRWPEVEFMSSDQLGDLIKR